MTGGEGRREDPAPTEESEESEGDGGTQIPQMT
jgi:hypothetical protein